MFKVRWLRLPSVAIVTAIGAAIVCAGVVAAIYTQVGGQANTTNSVATSGPVVFGTTSSNASTSAPLTPNAALTQAVKNAGDNVIVSATITTPSTATTSPSTATTSPSTATSAPPSLTMTVSVPALGNGLDIRPFWIADLITGAVADQTGTAASQRGNLAAVIYDAKLPGGNVVNNATSSAVGDVASHQVFPDQSEDDTQITSAVDTAAKENNLRTIKVDIIRALGPAPAVVLETDNPTVTLGSMYQLLGDLFGYSPLYEGSYLELRNADGKPILITSAAFRSGPSRYWVDPSYASDVKGIGSLELLKR